jgi:hypothetical protein
MKQNDKRVLWCDDDVALSSAMCVRSWTRLLWSLGQFCLRMLIHGRIPHPILFSAEGQLSLNGTLTCGLPMTLMGTLKPPFDIDSQRMPGVAWLDIGWLDHSFASNVELVSAFPEHRNALWMNNVQLRMMFPHDRARMRMRTTLSAKGISGLVALVQYLGRHGLRTQPCVLPFWRDLRKRYLKLCGLSPRRTIQTERLPLVGEVSSNFLRIEDAMWSEWRIPTAVFSVF